MKPFLIVILISGVISLARSCPPAEDLAPFCRCDTCLTGHTMLCTSIYTPEDLVGPIRSIAKHNVNIFSLSIRGSSLQYIPHAIFKGVKLEKIRLVSTELMSLSDTDVAFEGLEDILIELRATDANYITQWDWQSLRNLKKLELIDVNWISLGSIEDPFPELPHLTALGVIKAEISFIVDSAFAKLSGLKILNLELNEISEIKRNMLPNPANELTVLDFSDNKLRDLPEDFFTNMPRISDVYLDRNMFVTLSENAFQPAFLQVKELTMRGNPFRCDCRIRWIASTMIPFTFLASCDSPKSVAGKQIKFLDVKSLWC